MAEIDSTKHEKEPLDGKFDISKEADKVAGLIDKAAPHPGAVLDNGALKSLTCEIWSMKPAEMTSVLFHMQTNDSYPHFDPKLVDEKYPIVLFQTKDNRGIYVDLAEKPLCPENSKESD